MTTQRAGHSRASMTLDVYAHVMPLEEVPDAELRHRGGPVTRRPGVVPVCPRLPKAGASPHRCAGEGLHGIIIA
jgi:hypothetical protein